LHFLGKSLEKFGFSLEKLGKRLEILGKAWPPASPVPPGAPRRKIVTQALDILAPRPKNGAPPPA